MPDRDTFDLLVVGGGINGAGIAADAAGRGLTVLLAEMGDLAGATSSASSKLIHGGLRYLEHYEFRLVRHALAEREVLMRKAPHLIWPLRFVLPHVPGVRPRWMVRSGLFLYDHLYRREAIPGSHSIVLKDDPAGAPLQPKFTHAFSYYDCWVDDARLVLLNAKAAAERGAEVATRTRVASLLPDGDFWSATLVSGNTPRVVRARTLVNAAGPWVDQVDRLAGTGSGSAAPLRLVKGSHIVLPRLAGDNAYLMQSEDKRVVFALPFEERFTIIGTTDLAYEGDPAAVTIDAAEETYLLDLARQFFAAPLRRTDIIWRYSGVRPLYDDNEDDVSAVTRDYRLELASGPGAPPRLSVYGGKVTTYRRLAEDAMAQLHPHFPHMGQPWTSREPLPGGDLPAATFEAFLGDLVRRYPGIDPMLLKRMARRHGSRTMDVLGDARDPAALGRHFGHGLTEREVVYMRQHEWAGSAEDVLWRRSKVGLHLLADRKAGERATIEDAIARLL